DHDRVPQLVELVQEIVYLGRKIGNPADALARLPNTLAGQQCRRDHIAVAEAEPDRTLSGKVLQIFGVHERSVLGGKWPESARVNDGVFPFERGYFWRLRF